MVPSQFEDRMYARNPGNEAEFWDHLYWVRDAHNGARVSTYDYFPTPAPQSSMTTIQPMVAQSNLMDELTKALSELQLNVLDLQRRLD